VVPIFASEAKLVLMQLFREFLRRPRRQNSADTMGLAALRCAGAGRRAPPVAKNLSANAGMLAVSSAAPVAVPTCQAAAGFNRALLIASHSSTKKLEWSQK
jgi:hypothetical protein